MQLKEKIRGIVLDVIEGVISVDSDQVKDDQSFRDLGVDSLTALDILTALEREFSVKLGEETMRKFTTIETVSAVVEEVLAGKSQTVEEVLAGSQTAAV